MIKKRCFICASEEKNGHCTNPDCPRYKEETTNKDNEKQS